MSRTDLAIGPKWSSEKASGITPRRLTNPYVGFNPYTPDMADGMRIDPPVSVPNDTVQSQLPDPLWLEHWLDTQIRFDKTWETKVITTILTKLSNLFGVPVTNTKELNLYRKVLNQEVEVAG